MTPLKPLKPRFPSLFEALQALKAPFGAFEAPSKPPPPRRGSREPPPYPNVQIGQSHQVILASAPSVPAHDTSRQDIANLHFPLVRYPTLQPTYRSQLDQVVDKGSKLGLASTRKSGDRERERDKDVWLPLCARRSCHLFFFSFCFFSQNVSANSSS